MVRREISVFSKPVVFDKIYKGGNKVAVCYNEDRALIPVNEIMFYNGHERSKESYYRSIEHLFKK